MTMPIQSYGLSDLGIVRLAMLAHKFLTSDSHVESDVIT